MYIRGRRGAAAPRLTVNIVGWFPTGGMNYFRFLALETRQCAGLRSATQHAMSQKLVDAWGTHLAATVYIVNIFIYLYFNYV